MSMHMQFWIQQQTTKIESQASLHRVQVSQARTFQDVMRWSDIHVPAELRSIRHAMTGLRALNNAVESKLEQMIESRLSSLAEIKDLVQFNAEFTKLLQECRILRGNFGRFYVLAERRGSILRFQLEKNQTT